MAWHPIDNLSAPNRETLIRALRYARKQRDKYTLEVRNLEAALCGDPTEEE